MRVSIITVCLNSVTTIEQTIQSVLKQTWQDIEYIIVDGQSTDGTLDIIAKYENRIAKYVSEKDNGLYDAMNKGISMATGDVIGILNSDDWYAEDAVEKVVHAFQKENADLVYGMMEIVHPEGYTSRVKNDVLEHMPYRMVIPHPATFVRKKAYQETGVFDLQYKVLADYDLLLRMYLHHMKIHQIPEVLTYFRKGGFSTRHAVQCTEEMRSIARYYAEQRKDFQVLEKIEQYYQKRIKRAQTQDMAQQLLSKYRGEAAAVLQEWLDGNKKIEIFGAGSVGTECFYFLEELDVKIESFLDNDETKCCAKFLDKSVQMCSKRKDADAEKRYIVIAVISYQEEIIAQLESLGYQKEKDFCLFYELVEKIFRQVKEVKVIIPCYREYLTANEKISFLQCKRILKCYPMCIIKPTGLSLYEEELQGVEIETFDEEWFRSVQTYNNLMLTEQFYERFKDYEYILIYQLDAFVFRDELHTFCSLGYDYVGAPWLYGRFIYSNGTGGYYYVGNGGFSLRKVKAHLEILRENQTADNLNEDIFFSSREQETFRIAPIEVALKFAFETTVRKCYERNDGKMPFGCHAWQKYDFSFYKKIFQEFGYDTTDIKDEGLVRQKYNDFCDLSKLDKEAVGNALSSVLPNALNGLWIWGAGQIGKECGWLFTQNDIEIKGYIDNNKQMQETYLYAAKIVSAYEFFENADDMPLVIAMAHVPEEIMQALKTHHKVEGKDYVLWKSLQGKMKLYVDECERKR